MPDARKEFTAEEARRYGGEIGIDWSSAPFDVACTIYSPTSATMIHT